jgi:surface protein
MYGMFYGSRFNNDISKWDVSKVTDMEIMFKYSAFKQDISNWKINHNCDIKEMFFSCPMPIKY